MDVIFLFLNFRYIINKMQHKIINTYMYNILNMHIRMQDKCLHIAKEDEKKGSERKNGIGMYLFIIL